MTHFMQLPNKTITLLDQELALKNGEITFEFGGTEKVLVTETALQNAIAGMSAPITVATKLELDALALNEVELHKRVFVTNDGDAKWAYYMVTDMTGIKPTFIKISDEDIFGALFSDDVTAQISKIGALADLEPGMLNPATLIEGINTAYLQGVALNTRVGNNTDLRTTEKGTVVGAMNEIVVNITSNDGDILTIQNNIGDLATINLTGALDKATVVAAFNKVIAIQHTKLDTEDIVPIIVSYTGLLTELTTTNQNSLVEAINEIVADVNANENTTMTLTGALANLVTLAKTNLVAAVNEVQGNVVTETARATTAEATLQSNLDTETARATTAEATLQTNLTTEAATRAATDGDLITLTTAVKSNLVNAINEVDANSDAEAVRAIAAETALTTDLNNEVTARTSAATAIQAELDATQIAAGLGANGSYVADTLTNYISAATTLTGADKLLDAQSKVNADAIATETARATTAEQTLTAGLATTDATLAQEVTDRTTADSALDSRITTVEGQVNGNIGDLINLTTDDKTNLVGALNEVDAHSNIIATNLVTETARATTAEALVQTNLDTEAATRLANDNTLTADLTAETTRATAAETALQTNVTAEETARIAGDIDLTDNLATEIIRATTAEAVIQTNLDTEATTRSTNDGSLVFDASLNIDSVDVLGIATIITPTDLTDAINKEVTRATTAETTLTADLASEAARATTTENGLRTDLDAEIARATTAETTLDTKIDTAVSNLVEGAPELLDTLNELAAAIGDDANFSVTVATDIANAKAELRGAASIAMDTMKEIEDVINAEKTLRDNNQTATDTAITTEVTRATAAEMANTNAITALQASGTNITDVIQLELDATQTGAGLNTNGSFTADITTNYLTTATTSRNESKLLDTQAKAQADALITETTRATTAETTLTAALSTETARATAAESTLTTNLATTDATLATETTNRTTADNILQSNIDSAAATRLANDNALDSRITTVEGQVNGNIGNLINLTTDDKTNLVTALNEVDAHANTNATGLATEITDRTTAVTNESTLRANADTALTNDLASEVTRATGAEAANTAAIATEKTRAETAEGNLGFNATLTIDAGQGRTRLVANLTEAVNAEVARATVANTTTNTNLSAEVTRANAAETTLQTNIDNETARAIAAEATLTTDLASEVTRASAAEVTVQFNLDNETTRATAAETLLDSNVAAEALTRGTNDGSLIFNVPLADSTNLTDAINAELLRATTAEAANTTDINNETTRATAAEATLTTDLASEIARATASEIANADAIAILDGATDALIGNLTALDTTTQGTVVAAINEVNAETDVNTNQVSAIKAFINDMLNKSGKTLDSIALIANTAYVIDINDLASTNVAITVYSVSGRVLNQEYGMFVDVDTVAGTVTITSSIDVTAKVVIASDISGLTIA